MFASLGDILAAPDIERGRRGARTGQPVRRHSYAAGRERGTFWKPTNRQETRQILLAARRYEIETRQPGARNGALGFVALEIIELFANLIDHRSGRLDPSLDYLMDKLRRSRDAITRALKALRTHGFLDWLRRYVPTGNEGRGPQVKQTSNAYRLSIPACAMRLLGRYGQKPPIPDDHSHALETKAAAEKAHVASLSPVELVRHIHGDSPLGDALVRFALAREERESGKRSESRSRFI